MGIRYQRLQRIRDWRAAASEQSRHRRWIEALADEITVDAPHAHRVTQSGSAAQAPFERFLEQLGFIEFREHFCDRRTRDVARDAERLNLAKHSRPAMATEAHFRARARQRRSPVIQCALATQPCHGRVDVLRKKLPFHEARPQLGLGKLSTCEER
jgi:hypothetical protein